MLGYVYKISDKRGKRNKVNVKRICDARIYVIDVYVGYLRKKIDAGFDKNLTYIKFGHIFMT